MPRSLVQASSDIHIRRQAGRCPSNGRLSDTGDRSAFPLRPDVGGSQMAASSIRAVRWGAGTEFGLPSRGMPAEFFCLELEYSDLLGVDRAVLTKLIGLDLQHLGLVADLPGLLAERQDGKDGRDDREHCKDRGGYGSAAPRSEGG